MPKDTIYQLLGHVERDIREAYTGGAVDVYIPHNLDSIGSKFIHDKLYYYDVNSLYPYVMSTCAFGDPMPVGLPVVFEGNLREFEPNVHGFFYCKITAPIKMKHPIRAKATQRKIKTIDGIRTIAGLGSLRYRRRDGLVRWRWIMLQVMGISLKLLEGINLKQLLYSRNMLIECTSCDLNTQKVIQ
jgi:hypothetical protein